LNLHHPTTAKPMNEHHAREMLNRHRVWLNCYNLDRSMGSQYGKSPIIKTNDFLVSHSEYWWCSSPYNVPNFDIHICVYNADARVISEFMGKIYNDPNHPTGLNKVCFLYSYVFVAQLIFLLSFSFLRSDPFVMSPAPVLISAG
jgi:hypothetical protein